MPVGTIYGVVLNDRDERARLSTKLSEAPYMAPPRAPIVYIKPRMCMTTGGAPIPLPSDEPELVVAASLALLFMRDAAAVSAEDALDHVGAACLALDVSLPSASYYRPDVPERCRDGFMPLGRPCGVTIPDAIVTHVDGVEVHRWSLDRLVRPVATLIASLSAFMTLRAGDLLLIGLPGDAPRAGARQRIGVSAVGFDPIDCVVLEDVA